MWICWYRLLVMVLHSSHVYTYTYLTSDTADSQTVNMTNRTDILYHYQRICGTQSVCKHTNHTSKYPVSLPGCEDCSCSKDCHVSATCCPDVSYSSCIGTKVVGDKHSTDEHYIMIIKCPLSSNVELSQQCMAELNSSNFLDLYPVYSSANRLIYRNKYCAKCHGVTSFAPFVLDVICAHDSPNMNIYSTQQRLYNAFLRTSCNVTYGPPTGLTYHTCSKSNMIDTCNVTKQWDVYDIDVERACLNTYSPYSIYANAYCFLCNTNVNSMNMEVSNEDVISSCSDKSPSAFLTKSCVKGHLDARMFPYRNAFCFECNANDSLYSTDQKPQATIKSITEKFHRGQRYPYETLISFSPLSTFVWRSTTDVVYDSFIVADSPPYTSPDIPLHELYQAYQQFDGSMNWCYKDYKNSTVTKPTTECTCNVDCVTSGSCCPDAALSFPAGCVRVLNSREDSREKIYAMIDHCPANYTDLDIISKCHVTSDLHFPVWSLVENVTYKNIYCFICNNNSFHQPSNIKNKSLDVFKPWDLSISCKHHVILSRFKSIEAILHFTKMHDCEIQNIPTGLPEHQECLDSKLQSRTIFPIRECNRTGLWSTYKGAVHDACELFPTPIIVQSTTQIYFNIFCEMCNAQVMNQLISKCNVTGKWFIYESLEEILCEHGPYDPYQQFRNQHCHDCNMMFIVTITGEYERLPTLRQMFSTVEFIDSMSSASQESTELRQGTCADGFIYDHYRGFCRKLFCAAGKRIVDGTCVPLLPVTYNLVYTVTVKITSRDIGLPVFKLKSIFNTLENKLTDYFVSKTNVSLNTLAFSSLSNIPCRESGQYVAHGINEDLTMFAYATIKTGSDVQVHRLTFERQLYQALNGMFNSTFGSKTLSFEISPNDTGFLLLHSSSLGSVDTDGLCRKLDVNGEQDTSLLVNNMLFCRQLELDSTEYELTGGGLMRTIYTNRILDIDKFSVSVTKKARLCIKDYETIVAVKNVTAMEYTLSVVTVVCTSVSLVSLFITFGVYCYLPRLRTVPGKNIMCVCFSLFFAQLSFLFGSVDGGYVYCQIIGGFIHYFWLSTFFWMNISSYHMFRVFTRKIITDMQSKSKRTMFQRYCLYSFGTPLLILTIGLVISASGSKGSDVGYGGLNCFILGLTDLIVKFLLPVVCISVMNTLFLAITFVKIKRSPNVESTKAERDNFVIFVKLFSLTGITWLFQIVDGLFETSLFTFIVTIMNGGQGLFILLSYVCNRRVFMYLKNAESHSESSTGKTPLNSNSSPQYRDVIILTRKCE